jgi:co-chaperonin GroES (HSP10)
MVKAVSDKIIVEFLKREITSGGIIAPENALVDPQGYGKVMSVGEEVTMIKEGDFLAFHPRAGMDMVFDKKVFKVLKYDELYGVIEDKDFIAQFEPLRLVIKPQAEKATIIKPAGGFNA